MLATVLVIVALVPVGAASMITGDFSQMVYKPTRGAVHRFLKYRWLVIGGSVGLWAAGLVVHLAVSSTSLLLLIITGILLAVFTLLGFFMSPFVMFPGIRDAGWVSAGEADDVLASEAQVIGVEVNGDARAYPVDWSFRPHLVDSTIGGEPVVMSYCLLSNIGLAFRGEIDGERMRCIMPIQWENNMVIYDSAGDRLIQQIDPSVLHGNGVGKPLDVYPTIITTWRAWRDLHPSTRVFHNPPGGAFDRFVRRFIGTSFMEANRTREEPMFPTITRFDDRLPNKTEVIGVVSEGASRAYGLDRLAAEGVINDVIGEVPIVVVSSGAGVVNVFRRERNGDVATFERAENGFRDGSGSTWDVMGRTVDGSVDVAPLEPFPHFSRVLWFVWANFYPDTELAT